MFVSIFGSPILLTPKSSFKPVNGQIKSSPSTGSGYGGRGDHGVVIECSSRPKKKATAHHMKTRPRKTQAWDIKRKPTVYPPLPPLPPDWTLVSSGNGAEGDGDVGASAATEAALPPGAAVQAPVANG